MTSDLFDEYLSSAPGSKIELVDGQLIVGNSLMASRLLFSQILRGWGASAVVALAPEPYWWEALTRAFGAPPAPDRLDVQAEALRAWALSYERRVEIPAFEPRWSRKRLDIRDILSSALFGLSTRLKGLGQSLGRGVVNRLGNDGFMPDIFFFRADGLNRLYEYYLDGPAELIVEVLIPGYERYDREVKREYYRAGGVPEYWIVDPTRESIELLRLVDGEYQLQHPDFSGRYLVSSIPGLTFFPNKVWEPERRRSYLDEDLFEVAAEAPRVGRLRSLAEGFDWSRNPFVFPVELEPVPIQFEDYLYWCPEAKFEFVDGKPWIGCKEGIRGLIGMFLMTFGLVETVKLLHPKLWVAALLDARVAAQKDQEHKAAWWELAQQAASLLREQHGATRLAVAGDLVKPEPLNFWSELILVAWALPSGKDYMSEPHGAIYDLRKNPRVHLIEADGHLAPMERQALSGTLIEI